MRLSDVRKRYIAFFERRGHRAVPSTSLVPENDPTTLFTGSGMQPLLPFLLGEPHPLGRRVVNAQKCFRAEDIEEVGDNRHTTFFEMLGNWSFGDPEVENGIGDGYFKTEQIPWFFSFLTDPDEGIGLDPHKLFVTVFAGNEGNGIPRDGEAAGIWKKLFQSTGVVAEEAHIGSVDDGYRRGMREGERIFYYDAQKNWWSRAGSPDKMPTGEPGGPDSEVFYDFGEEHDARFGAHCHPNCDCGRFMEIGNSVFMQYRKRADGGFDELPQKNVDFGGGLERITAASLGDPDVFAVDALHALTIAVGALADKKYSDADEREIASFRIVADHVRAAAFMIADGVVPGNTERNYFVRRLIRRAVHHMDTLGAPALSLGELARTVAHSYERAYPAIKEAETKIVNIINTEEKKFRESLKRGVKETERTINLNGAVGFNLYQTFGISKDKIIELAQKRGEQIDIKKFDMEFIEEMKKHQSTSRAGAEQKFKGGLADESAMSVRYHTATHLLHQALRDVLGEHVFQKGSNITPERLRFDFIHHTKMTDEEKKKVENIINEKIAAALPVSFEILPVAEAKKRGAIGLFDDQYGDTVKVYKIGERAGEAGAGRESGLYSLEFCGGPHVANTRELGDGGRRFVIEKEEAVSAGIRRIRAVLTNT